MQISFTPYAMEKQRKMSDFDFEELTRDIKCKKDGASVAIFSVNIYQRDLYFDSHQSNMLGAALQAAEAKDNKQMKPSNYTGDVNGFGEIHNLEVFSPLIREIEKSVIDYIATFSKMSDQIQVYHQKSWPVIINEGGCVDCHQHSNADLSAVYYLDVPIADGGELVFYSPLTLGLPSNSSGVDFFISKAYAKAIKPYKGLLVIFPSALKHEVREYHGKEPRVSLSFDFTITASEEQGSGRIENLPPSIRFWRAFK